MGVPMEKILGQVFRVSGINCWQLSNYGPKITPTLVNVSMLTQYHFNCLGHLDSLRAIPRQQKFRAMNGAHLASPIRGELGYAHWPQLRTQFIALLGTKFGAH